MCIVGRLPGVRMYCTAYSWGFLFMTTLIYVTDRQTDMRVLMFGFSGSCRSRLAEYEWFYYPVISKDIRNCLEHAGRQTRSYFIATKVAIELPDVWNVETMSALLHSSAFHCWRHEHITKWRHIVSKGHAVIAQLLSCYRLRTIKSTKSLAFCFQSVYH